MTATVTVSGLSGSLASAFTYAVIPTVTSVSPNSGSTTGGTAVTITGSNFATASDRDVWRHSSSQRSGGEQYLHHGHNACRNRRCGYGDRNGRRTERKSDQRIHLRSYPHGDQRVTEYRFDGRRNSSHDHRHELRDRSDGEIWCNRGTERRSGEQYEHHGHNSCGKRRRGHGDRNCQRAERKSDQRIHLCGGHDHHLRAGRLFGDAAIGSGQCPSHLHCRADCWGSPNVVVVGWNDSTATVSKITDNGSNTYTRAVGPTVFSGFATQSIYYAKNIVAAAAGANIVTITFSSAAPFPDIRILEYKGADPNNPVDVTAASSGSSATSSSGAATKLITLPI